MTIKRIILLLIGIPIAIFASSALYKVATGFYGYKHFTCTHFLPRIYGTAGLQALTLHDVSENLTVIQGIPIPATLSPECFTNRLGAIGVRFKMHDGSAIEAYHPLRDLLDVRDWFASYDEGTSTEILLRGYGSWENVRLRFPTDIDLLDEIYDFTLPSYLSEGSTSMSYPWGYYLFPLFPPWISYKYQLTLNAVRAVNMNTSMEWYRAAGDHSYFLVKQTERATEITYGTVNGNIRGVIMVRNMNGSVDLSTVESLCSWIEALASVEKEKD